MQDFFYPMSAVAGSGKQGVELCWEFFQENFAAITCMLANASPSLMNAVIVYCCGGACSEERADAIAAFFKASPVNNPTAPPAHHTLEGDAPLMNQRDRLISR